ncbi:hypothetical protein GCM10022222_29230 [Amycolatopsis ultiminotia]|uniref:Uncharacterized protein n=1 Tax=Amycolatopsis ultiminotia TaxID=543629 RepID=A0ABP6W2J9_9PSEU
MLGSVGDWAGTVSAVAGFAALFPPCTPFAAPVAALTGGVALVAHSIAQFDDSPAASAGKDAAGLGSLGSHVFGAVQALP